ncbi:MAG: hypothetical protein NTW44_08055 [Nitrospirae bacterium]|nr:hypothetical protein [Nitrospirota bacterium]
MRRTFKGSVIDLRPLDSGKVPLLFKDGVWVDGGKVKVGVISDSKPLTAEEAAALTDGSIVSQ